MKMNLTSCGYLLHIRILNSGELCVSMTTVQGTSSEKLKYKKNGKR